MCPVHYDGTEDWEEYLSQFEILADINKWEDTEKGLYLASSLKGSARSILSDLNQEERRDFSKLKLALSRKFGSEYKAEMYRAKLQSRYRLKSETISELATSIMKLTRQAYPKAQLSLLDTLAVDYFIDALDDPDIRLRLRQSQPESITQAETLAIRLETFKAADKVKHRTVCSTSEHSDSGISEDKSDVEKHILPVLETFMNKISNEVDSIKSSVNSKSEGRNQFNKRQNFAKGKGNVKQQNSNQPHHETKGNQSHEKSKLAKEKVESNSNAKTTEGNSG